MSIYVIALIAVATRAVAFLSDDRCSLRRLLILAFLSAAATAGVARMDAAFWLSMVSVVLPQTLLPLITERFRSRVAWRLLLLPLVAVPFLLPTAYTPHTRKMWSVLLRWFQTVPAGHALFAKIVPTLVFTHLAGLILCLSDGNQFLRSTLRLLGISPPAVESSEARPPDAAQYLRGGLVGAVERLLIYIFAANAAFNAIAFVITVKGIVRYQEIVKNHSAEYVLVGTLLSTLMAMSLGMLFVHAA